MKDVYVIYNSDEKDSNVYTARNELEAFDIAFQTIFDTEEFDEFFNDKGEIVITKANKMFFFECLKGWKLYKYGKYDPSSIKMQFNDFPEPVDFKEYMDIMNQKVAI